MVGRAEGCWLSVALRKESVDRNGGLMSAVRFATTSLSARRAWIEIMISVDKIPNQSVALRKESVDRNRASLSAVVTELVALRKESVDRNTSIDNLTQGVFKSLSARRAWIEMTFPLFLLSLLRVALRKESVDRNTQRRDFKRLGLLSLSARRAWIEM